MAHSFQGSISRETELLPPSATFLSSQSAGWDGLLLEGYQLPEHFESPRDTVYSRHVLACYLEGESTTFWQWRGQTQQAQQAPGGLSLFPVFDLAHRCHARRLRYTALHLEPRWLERVAAETGHGAGGKSLIELIPQMQFHDPFVAQIVRWLMTEAASVKSGEPGLAGRLYADSLGVALAVHLLRHHAVFPIAKVDAPTRASLPAWRLRSALEFINDQLARNFSLAELARAAGGMSRAHFGQLFRRSTGMSPHRYVVRRRVERAKELLCAGRLSLAEVAVAVGFYDQSHLNRHFLRAEGISPAGWQRQQRSR